MASRSPALVLLVLGLVLLPGPMYGAAFDRLEGPERHRAPTGYVATPIDAANDSVLAGRYAHHVSFQSSDLQYRHVADDHRAPNRTRRVLERAIRRGEAATGDDAVRSDLRRIERNHTFLTIEYDEYYQFSVAESDGATTLRTTRATDAEIASAIRDEIVVGYADLPPAERQTFRKIRNATEADSAYRPWSDEPVPEQTLVRANGTYYDVEGMSHFDDFGPSRAVLYGFLASLVGVGCLLAGGLFALHAWLSGRGETES